MKNKSLRKQKIILGIVIIGLLLILVAHAKIAYKLEITNKPLIEKKIQNKDASYLYTYYITNTPQISRNEYLGSAQAPITIIYYTDLTCEQCRAFQTNIFPEIKNNYIDSGRARFYPKIIVSDEEIANKSGNFIYARSLECINTLNPSALENWYVHLYQVKENQVIPSAKNFNVSSTEFESCMYTMDNSNIIENTLENDEFGIIVPRLYIGIQGQQNDVITGVLSNQTISIALRNKGILLGE